jgi:hypothetical protein
MLRAQSCRTGSMALDDRAENALQAKLLRTVEYGASGTIRRYLGVAASFTALRWVYR